MEIAPPYSPYRETRSPSLGHSDADLRSREAGGLRYEVMGSGPRLSPRKSSGVSGRGGVGAQTILLDQDGEQHMRPMARCLRLHVLCK